MSNHQKTFTVDHPGTHQPDDAQVSAAFRAVVKADGVKVAGDPSFRLVENTSGGPSKYVATYDVAGGE